MSTWCVKSVKCEILTGLPWNQDNQEMHVLFDKIRNFVKKSGIFVLFVQKSVICIVYRVDRSLENLKYSGNYV